MSGSDSNGGYVTNRELNDKLDKLRWEIRFLILSALVASQLLPVTDVAKAALDAIP